MKREKFITTKAAHTNPNPQSKEQEHVHENPYVAVEALESSLTSLQMGRVLQYWQSAPSMSAL